jgi:hypothetical protein
MNEKLIPSECTRFEGIFDDLDRPGAVDSVLRESAIAHAESCSRCALQLTQAESLDLAFHSIAGADGERKASPRVEAALLEEFRRLKTTSGRRRLRSRMAGLGVAAATLLALGLSLHHFSSAPQGSRAQPGRANQAALPVSSSRSPVLDSQSGHGEGALVADSASFISLPYADDPAAVQEDAVVRVVLSPSALASLGLPVALIDGGQSVSADLRVSDDGTPQAIRLVSQNAEQSF